MSDSDKSLEVQKRHASVYRRMLMGQNLPRIAKALHVSLATVKRDVAEIRSTDIVRLEDSTSKEIQNVLFDELRFIKEQIYDLKNIRGRESEGIRKRLLKQHVPKLEFPKDHELTDAEKKNLQERNIARDVFSDKLKSLAHLNTKAECATLKLLLDSFEKCTKLLGIGNKNQTNNFYGDVTNITFAKFEAVVELFRSAVVENVENEESKKRIWEIIANGTEDIFPEGEE